jgi:hypothetical protein
MPARKRRAGRATELAACAALRLRARSPAGIPLTVFTSGTFVPRAQLRARLPEDDAKAAACRTHRHQSQRCTSRAGHSAGRHDARAAGCGVYLSARGEPHSLRRQGVPSQTASLKSEISGVYCRRFRQVKGVGNFVDKTIRFVLRSFEEVRGTPMIRIKRANFRVVVFPRRRAIQQNQNALVNSG